METQQTSEATGSSTNSDQSTGLRQQHGGEWVEKAIAILFDEEDRAEVARDYQAGDEYALSQFNIRIEELARELEATHKAAIEQAREEIAIECDRSAENCEAIGTPKSGERARAYRITSRRIRSLK